jgi:hypothetical protein
VVLGVSLAVLAGCSTTGESFRASGLDHIVAGRTTMAQAIEDLGAQPVNTWQQGDTLLARWAYKGTVATDAVYFRQEVWLRFGPDGRFLRTENAINVPVQYHTRTAAEADREAAEARAREAAAHPAAPPAPAAGAAAAASDAPQGDAAPSLAIPVPPAPAVQPEPASPAGDASSAGGSAPGATPLLPEGTQVIPGATYPLGAKTH